MRMLTQAMSDRVSKLIWTSHYIAKEGLAFQKFASLCYDLAMGEEELRKFDSGVHDFDLDEMMFE